MISNHSAVEIDGALGEGGGQVLRSALTLSMLTQRPVVLRHIRAKRPQPGLKPQHLKSVDAAAEICRAEVDGAQLNSQTLAFKPAETQSGRYRFDIGTAGASTLVLQTIFLPLAFAPAASSVTITGGTHVPWSPPYHYLELHWLPMLQKAGYQAQLSLQQAGYYPQGGGRIEATIRPVAATPLPLRLDERGALRRIYGVAGSSNLPEHVTERMKRQTLQRLQNLPEWRGQPDLHVKSLDLPAPGKGAFIVLVAEYENGRGCFTALGEIGKPSERVADDAIDDLLAFHASGAAMDPCLADQLLLPLALASGPSTLTTSAISQHLLTQAEVIRQFLPVQIDIETGPDGMGWVKIVPAA
jgi:RNA 3'-terminal phosphate cyclase (ATP)